MVGWDIRLNISNVPWRQLQQLVLGLSVRSVSNICLAAGESTVTASFSPSWGWTSSPPHAPELRQRAHFLKAPTELPRLYMKELSLLIAVVPVCSSSVGLFLTVPVPPGALHKTRHDLCPKEFHQAARCLAARKSPAIIHTLKIAGAKWEPAFQNQVHYVSAKYIIST